MFLRVFERHRAAMKCGAGCAECCHQRLTVTGVEAEYIRAGLAKMDAGRRGRISANAISVSEESCAALDGEGRCLIYELRPLVCRSHGAPIRTRDPERGLPVINACYLNFDGGEGLEALPDEDVVDQATVSTVLGALDAAFADERGLERGRRFDLARLLVDHAD